VARSLESFAVAVALATTLAMSAPVHTHAQPQPPVPKLTVATASAHTAYSAIWIALDQKLFAKHGVDVELVNSNALSTGAAMIASGNVDLLATTVFLGIRIAAERKPLSIIMNLSNIDGRGNALVARPDVTSIEQLAAMGDRCKVNILPQGSATWAFYLYISEAYKLRCGTNTASTPQLAAAGFLSGHFEAALINPQEAYGAREAGKANILLDPLTMTKREAELAYPYHHPLSVLMGLRANLQSKKQAVIRFVAALKEATALMKTFTPQQFAETAGRLPDVFGSTPASVIKLQYQIQMIGIWEQPNDGRISEADWKDLVAAAPKGWGFSNFNFDAENTRYADIVDMSYLDAAK